MLSILLLSFSIHCLSIPKYSILGIGSTFTPDVVASQEKVQEIVDDMIKEICAPLSGKDKDICLEPLKARLKSLYGLPSQAEKLISDVPKESEYLFVSLIGSYGALDFGKLKSKMVVVLDCRGNFGYNSKDQIEYMKTLMTNMIKYKFDGTRDSALMLTSSIENNNQQNKKDPKAILSKTKLVGDIGSKVSFLTILNAEVTFINSPCNCDTVYLVGSTITSVSQTVKSKYLIANLNSNNYLSASENIKVSQYHLYYYVTKDYRYKISYETNSLAIYASATKDFSNANPKYISYNMADTIGVILISFYIDVSVDDENLDAYNSINITHMNWSIPLAVASPLEKEEIIFVTTGNWENVDSSKIPKITLTADYSNYKVNTDGSKLKINKKDVYTFKPKKKTNVGLIVGIVVAVVVVIVIIIVVVVVVLRKKRNANNASSNEGNDKNDEKV